MFFQSAVYALKFCFKHSVVSSKRRNKRPVSNKDPPLIYEK